MFFNFQIWSRLQKKYEVQLIYVKIASVNFIYAYCFWSLCIFRRNNFKSVWFIILSKINYIKINLFSSIYLLFFFSKWWHIYLMTVLSFCRPRISIAHVVIQLFHLSNINTRLNCLFYGERKTPKIFCWQMKILTIFDLFVFLFFIKVSSFRTSVYQTNVVMRLTVRWPELKISIV